MLDLKRPIYQQTASYGHFGRTEDSISWEKIDRGAPAKIVSFLFVFGIILVVPRSVALRFNSIRLGNQNDAHFFQLNRK